MLELQDTHQVTRNTEVRHLSETHKQYLAKILSNSDNWKKLMSILPKNVDEDLSTENYPKKYTAEDIQTIENASGLLKNGRSNAEIVLYEWSTSGKKRPCVEHLLLLFSKLELYRAADYLCGLIGENLISNYRLKFNGSLPASIVQLNTVFNQLSIGTMASKQQMAAPESSNLIDLDSLANHPDLDYLMERAMQIEASELPVVLESQRFVPKDDYLISYNAIAMATHYFDATPFSKQGHLLGTGGFGRVFFARNLSKDIPCAAVKVIDRYVNEADLDRMLRREVEALKKCRHENLIRLLGYSLDGSRKCLVYEFASGGTLSARLDESRKSAAAGAFPWRLRHSVLTDCARAIHYLHEEVGLVHRDIKPANVLLENDVAKLCDFGQLKEVDMMMELTKSFGTPFYAAPEVTQGDVSKAVDIFSFGVVVMEVATGLEVCNSDRWPIFLGLFVKERFESESLVDKKAILDHQEAELWEANGTKLIELGLKCSHYEKSERPEISGVLEALKNEIKG